MALSRVIIAKSNDANYVSPTDTFKYPSTTFKVAVEQKQFYMLNYPLQYIYQAAYFGQMEPFDPRYNDLYGKAYNRDVFYEGKNPSIFKWDAEHQIGNLYCVSVIMPAKSTSEDYQIAVIDGLDNCFKLKSRIEIRKMPCWNLVTISEKSRTKLLTKGNEKLIKTRRDGFHGQNCSVKDLIAWLLRGEDNFKYGGTPVIDKTGIEGNIDIDIDSLVIDWNDMMKGLKSSGLELVKSYTEMQVLVIRDADAKSVRLATSIESK